MSFSVFILNTSFSRVLRLLLSSHREVAIIFGLLDEQKDAVREGVALQSRGRRRRVMFALIVVIDFFAASGEGLAAAFRRVFARRGLKSARIRCAPAVTVVEKRGGRGFRWRDTTCTSCILSELLSKQLEGRPLPFASLPLLLFLFLSSPR